MISRKPYHASLFNLPEWTHDSITGCPHHSFIYILIVIILVKYHSYYIIMLCYFSHFTYSLRVFWLFCIYMSKFREYCFLLARCLKRIVRISRSIAWQQQESDFSYLIIQILVFVLSFILFLLTT